MKFRFCCVRSAIAICVMLGAGGWQATAAVVRLAWSESDIEVVFAGDASNLLGIGRVRIGSVVVSDGPTPGRPLIETESGGRYARCRFVRLERRGSEQVVVTDLEEKKSGVRDRLEWRFRPTSLRVRNREYAGIEYAWRFRSRQNRVRRIVDLTDWTLGGRPDDLYLVPPRQVAGRDSLHTRPAVEFLRTPCFYFQGGDAGCMLIARRFDDGTPWVRTGMERAAGAPEIRFTDEILCSPGTEAGTSWRRVLVCPEARLTGLALEDEYARCLDALEAEVRAHFGIREPDIRRLCVRASEGIRPRNSTPTYDAVIPLLDGMAAAGFERVWPGCIWNNAGAQRKPPRPNLQILDMTLSPYGGGEVGLRRLIAAAEEHGLGVYTWSPSGQLTTASRYWKEHPEWFPKNTKGKRYDYSGSTLTWTDLNSGYYRMAMDGFRRARALGIRGMWFDSFGSVAAVVDYGDPEHLGFNILPAFRRMKELQDMGFEMLYIEGRGPAGVDGYPQGDLDEGGYASYKSGHFVYHVRPDRYDVYFRRLANLAPPILAWQYTLRTYRGNAITDHPEYLRRITYDNRAFRQVREQMRHRRLIAAPGDPWHCIGVEWSDDSGRPQVVWAYETQDYTPPAGHRVVEVLDRTPARMRGRTARLDRERVYRILLLE
ncbi:MAG: hypothetical protein GXP31_16435 [Kiritimatiellaeota bacterium]|nr:hypothetical protein [Kiritimatiellota bacterium]